MSRIVNETISLKVTCEPVSKQILEKCTQEKQRVIPAGGRQSSYLKEMIPQTNRKKPARQESWLSHSSEPRYRSGQDQPFSATLANSGF